MIEKRGKGFWAYLPWFMMLALSVGCQKENPDGRLDVTGTIKLNGQLLPGGSIAFSDTNPDQAGGGGGVIKNGKFLLTGDFGLKPGDYMVRIRSAIDYDHSTGQPAGPDAKMENLRAVELVPEEYNSKTQLSFSVQEKKKNVFDYDIKADPPVYPPPKKK